MVDDDTTLGSLMELGHELREQLVLAGFTDLPHNQALAIAEEAGEFVGAYRRWAGLARRTGNFQDVAFELADLVITAFVTAAVLNMDLPLALDEKLKIIFSRGWREPQAINVIIQPANEANTAKGVNQ